MPEQELQITTAAKKVVELLKLKAGYIGVPEDNIERTYNPEAIKKNLKEDAAPQIEVYVDDADPVNPDETGVTTRNISIGIAIYQKLSNTTTEGVDGTAAIFEKVQDVLIAVSCIDGYCIGQPETNEYCHVDTLRNERIALFIISVDVQNTRETDFESIARREENVESEEENVESETTEEP